MSHAIHTFRLRRLWACIHTSLYSNTTLSNPTHPTYRSRVTSLRGELDEWYASTPSLEHNGDKTLSVFTGTEWFKLTYGHSILLLYRGQITNSKGPCSDEVYAECFQTAQQICHGYNMQYIGRPTSYTWGALHLLFVAGLTYLHCLWASPITREKTRYDEVSNTCTDCTMVLVIMAERLEAAASFRDMFKALAKRTMTMMVDKNDQDWIFSGDPMRAHGPDSENMAEWMAGINNTGLSVGVSDLLDGLVGNLE